MAETAVSFVVTKLSTWILEESLHLGGLSEEAEYIRDEMDRMKAFLRVADENEDHNPLLKIWIAQVRKIAEDVEDVVDKFTLWFGRERMQGTCGSLKRIYVTMMNFRYRCQISLEIRSLHSRVRKNSEAQKRYTYILHTLNRVPTHSTKCHWYDSRDDALLMEESEVVGIEKPREELLKLISATNLSSSKVISVVGPGGLRKTTLVRKVYDDATIKTRFNSRLWITVSNTFDLKTLLTSVIRKLVAEVRQPSPRELKEMDINDMKEFIYNFLQQRTYIIVLDDVWKLSDWASIKYAFPRSSTHGCVLITTRFRNVGYFASSEGNGHVYNLKPLSPKDSQHLFYKKAFLGNSCPGHLEEIAGIFLKRCEGLPLAIIVIGSLLSRKNNNINEWMKFLQCLGDELEGDCRMTKLLSLSYHDLPYHLRYCFLYFSVFPEDHRILTRRLIRLWIAEGFVQRTQEKSMEEIANDYIKELYDRCLIEVEGTTNYGNPDRIHVHDIIHKIIVSKSKEQNFVTIANGQNTSWQRQSRRLAIHATVEDMVVNISSDSTRSVLVFDSLSEKNLSKLIKSCSRLINVLELRGGLAENIPKEVFELYHLKYLSLKNTKVKIVPKLINNLQCLETLDLRDTNVRKLPAEITKLRKLRHLMVYYYKSHRGYRPFNNVHSCNIPHKISRLSSLQTLSDIEATNAGDSTIVREIGYLSELKRLGIMKLREEDGKDLCSSLAKLTKLESLHIASTTQDEILNLHYPLPSFSSLEILELRGPLHTLPHWLPSFGSLKMLYLRWSKMKEDPLSALQKLPNLAELELYRAYTGNSLRFKSGGFQRLKKLWLLRLEGLRLVNVEEGSMPFLQNLYIWGCKLIEEAPLGIRHLKNLQYVDFSDMSEEFVTSIGIQKEKGAKEWKFSRIPTIEIYSFIDGECKYLFTCKYLRELKMYANFTSYLINKFYENLNVYDSTSDDLLFGDMFSINDR